MFSENCHRTSLRLKESQCVERNSLEWDDISKCQSSVEGQTLLHDYGVDTLALEPDVTWVPWITINGVMTNFGIAHMLLVFKQRCVSGLL